MNREEIIRALLDLGGRLEKGSDLGGLRRELRALIKRVEALSDSNEVMLRKITVHLPGLDSETAALRAALRAKNLPVVIP
jgi:hypothetical protein